MIPYVCKNLEGSSIEICDGVLSCRGKDGGLGLYVLVSAIKAIDCGEGNTGSAIRLGIADEHGNFDPQGKQWHQFEFDDQTAHALAASLKAAIDESKGTEGSA